MRKGHLLVVDDDQSFCRYIDAALRGEGYEVSTARDGQTALRWTEGHRADLILLDLAMPGMDGREFAASYRKTAPPHAPIVVVTGTVDERRASEEVQRLDARGFVLKPIDAGTLLDVIRRHVPDSAKARPGSAPGAVGMRTGPLRSPKDHQERHRPTPRFEERREAVARVGRRLAQLRSELAAVQERSRALVALEETRPLTRAEALRAAAVRRESERLRLELAVLRDEFEQLRGGGE
jgi:CheY-like chemotaxis protein